MTGQPKERWLVIMIFMSAIDPIGFSLNVCNFLSLNSANSVTKICHSIIGLELLSPSNLLCKRPACYQSTSTTHVKDRTIKLTLVYASVIYQFPWICWIHWNPVLFRENPNVCFGVSNCHGASGRLCRDLDRKECNRRSLELPIHTFAHLKHLFPMNPSLHHRYLRCNT